MNKFMRAGSAAMLVLACIVAHAAATNASQEEAKLLVSAKVLDETRTQRDQQIPQHLLQRAYGVAVIPSVTKLALLVGGRRGSGVLTVRDSRGRFSSPIFVNITGVSFGAQFGAQDADIVLVFTTRRGVEGIADGKLTLGVGASVAAGPVGRQADAAVTAEVYAYSRARGLFLGVALDGTSITINHKSNAAWYGRKDVLVSDIISGAAAAPASENASRFLAALAAGTGETAEAAQPATPVNVSPAPIDPGPRPPPGGSQVQTFPMEDPAPGAAPPR